MPLINEGGRAGCGCVEGDGGSLVDALRGGGRGDGWGGADELHLVHPAAVSPGGEAGIFGVGPLQDLAVCGDVERDLLPIDFARDLREQSVADRKLQEIFIGFGRNFPPEADDAGAALGSLDGSGGVVADEGVSSGID